MLRADASLPEPLHLLGLTLARAGAFEDAAATLAEAIRHKPAQGEWYCDLGTVQAARREWSEAAHAFQKAHELIPMDAHNLLSYAQALYALKRFDECARIALLLLHAGTCRSKALSLLSSALWQAGDLPAFSQTLRAVSESGWSDSATDSFRLSGLLHDATQTGTSIVEGHRSWEQRYCAQSAGDRAFNNSLDTERRLRVGYLTGEFACCPGYHFLSPLLRGHDRNSVEIFCYQTRKYADSCARLIQQFGHHWHEVHHLDDEALSRLVRSHEIDVLVDFSGHFNGHRLCALSGRLAPVQVFYPNYPATSGLANMDYVLTDEWHCPPGLENNYSEKVYRVPSGYIVYSPPGECAIRSLPARSNGFITFGIFQRPQKISSDSWDAIGEVLRTVPDSRLLIQYDSALRPRFSSELEARGVAGTRLDVRDWLPLRERVLLLGEVDIALDTFPYNGQTTTCECLWMGVPVVTRSGRTHVSRVAGSLLQQVGLSEWIAESNEEYAAIARWHANDLDGLEVLRRSLRGRVAASPLVDAPRKAREMEEAYRAMWRAWVQAASTPSREPPTRNAS